MTHGTRMHIDEPESHYLGVWNARHPLNDPGPFYGAETDTCCDGPPLAPCSLLYDHAGAGLVCLPIGGYSDHERRLLRGIVTEFIEYRRTRLDDDLRRYVYFLEIGRYPDAGAALLTP